MRKPFKIRMLNKKLVISKICLINYKLFLEFNINRGRKMNKIEKGIESNMVYLQIKELMENARKQVSVKINNILVQTYWKIGKIIIEDEQKNNERAEIREKTFKRIVKKIDKRIWKGLFKIKFI